MKPHKVFAMNPDPAAMAQFYDAMKLDCVVRGAVMPDVHKGYALPIGAVVATEGMIFPSWAGYDLGCGVYGVRTTFARTAVENHKTEIFNKIFEWVPTGVGKYYDKPIDFAYPLASGACTNRLRNLYLTKKADTQLGTLGGGNHFIEVGCDENDSVWIVVHSGSRGFGHSVATAYMALAADGRCSKEGNYGFRTDSALGLDYISDMNFCLEFALKNRAIIANRTAEAISCIGISGGIYWKSLINRNHNHIVERGGLWIHRKGATHAESDMLGVVPGNMRDGSFIVKGLGNPDSLWSSSHGAGRVMSRTQAKQSIKLETLQEQMRGIAAKTDMSVLDEAPDAYKNLFEVMSQQRDLVQVVHHVKPIISVKG